MRSGGGARWARSRPSAQGVVRGGAVGASWWRCEDGGGAILLQQCRGDWGFAVGFGRGLGVGGFDAGFCGFWFRVGWVLVGCLVEWVTVDLTLDQMGF
uniref:Uncharacterized protein n=1 Tax=Fagus sylvatica TaxID=28930 RepID=A0A2N9G590_FAGSY